MDLSSISRMLYQLSYTRIYVTKTTLAEKPYYLKKNHKKSADRSLALESVKIVGKLNVKISNVSDGYNNI